MILLKQLKIKNFISHEKTEINFGENDKLLLSGKSGSGKSSIVEAILWTLYGKGRSENRSLVRKGAQSAEVSLKFIDRQLETIITRSVSDKGKTKLLITQNTGTKKQFLPIKCIGLKEIQEWIEKTFLHASFELFTNSIAYPQDNENSFVKATATRRKDLLLEIVGAGNFDELYKKTRDALSKNEVENAVNESKITNLESIIKEATEEAGKAQQYKNEVNDLNTQIKQQEKVKITLEQKINNISSIVQQINDKQSTQQILTNSLNKIIGQLQEDELTITNHKKIDIEQAKVDVKKADTLITQTQEIEKTLESNAEAQMKINSHLANKPSIDTDHNKDIENLNTRLIPLIKDSGSCPAGDKCPFVVPIKGQITFLTGQIEEKTEKNKNQKEALVIWEKEYATLVPVSDTSTLYTDLKNLKENISVLNQSKNIIIQYELSGKMLEDIQVKGIKYAEEMTQLNQELATINKSVEDLKKELKTSDSNQLNLELSTTNNVLVGLQQKKDATAIREALATQAQDTFKNASTTIVACQKTSVTARGEREALELLKEALSPKGIKAVIVDYIVPQLEERINDVLGQMSEFRIRIDTQQGKADGEGTKEGLFLTIKNDVGEELPLQNLSGGEGIKVSMAISEALASLMPSMGFRILDEAVTALDIESTQSFVEVLLKLQERFPQLLAISHLVDVQEIFTQQIKVIKINGVSKISE